MKLIQFLFEINPTRLSKNKLFINSKKNLFYNQFIKSKYIVGTTTNSSSYSKLIEPESKELIEATNKSPIEKKQEEIIEKKNDQTWSLISSKSTLVDSMPKVIQPYLRLMRVDKPIGTYVTLWPGVWSILASASLLNQSMPDYKLIAIFVAGAFTMRSAGCIINDMWDRNYDSKVERTKMRPLASGQIGIPAALTLLAANLGISVYLLLQLNLVTQILGACALFPIVIYPSAKRFSNWPQFYLGLAINWAALMGWTAVFCNDLSTVGSIFSLFPGLLVYTSCVSWTIFYDTIYGHQDKVYDKKLGLKSTVFTFGRRQKSWLLGFSTLATSNLCLVGYFTNQEPIFYAFMGLVYAHLLKQTFFVDLNSPESCNKHFRSNNTVGFLVSLGLLLSLFAR